jgi:hypothetical protein
MATCNVGIRTVRMFSASGMVLAFAGVFCFASAVTIHVPAEQPTIQEGIDAASAGDTVLVAQDSYSGPLNRDLNFGGKSIVLLSDSLSPRSTISCGNAGRGFLFNSGEDTTTVVRGFNIVNAIADSGAGVCCLNGSSPKFDQCEFMFCQAQSMGGGIFASGSSPVFRDCRIWVSSAEGTGRDGGYGGGMACVLGSSPLIVNTDFLLNDAGNSGGGLYAHQSSPTVVGCSFEHNTVGEYGQGAGVKLHQCTGASFADCDFFTNGVSTCVGGGMHASASTFDVTDCDFVNNISGASGGIHLTDGATASVTGCTFAKNEGLWSAAGAIQCVLGSDATISNCTFADNGWSHVWCDGTSPTLEYCILAFSSEGVPVYCETGSETPYIHHCFVYGNEGGDVLCGANYHDIEYADPVLCGYPWDVTLCSDSPRLPANNQWEELIGALGEGCGPCGTAVQDMSWGSIKAMYRAD